MIEEYLRKILLILNYFKIWRYLQQVFITLKPKMKYVKESGLFFPY